MEISLKRVSSHFYQRCLGNLPPACVGDFTNGGITSVVLPNDSTWIILKENDKRRHLQCAHDNSLAKDTIFVKEDVYFNICTSLGMDCNKDTNKIKADFVKRDFFPCVADTAKVSQIRSAYEFGNEDEELLLSDYFSNPRHLFVGDVFSIPLPESLYKSACYQGIYECIFKVVSLSSSNDTAGALSEEGSYLFKEVCDLYSIPSSSSYLPPKPREFFEGIDSVPPDLNPHVTKLTRLLTPFISDPKLDCLPFFIAAGNEGSGKVKTLKLVADTLGLHTVLFNAYEISSVGAAAAEAKWEFLLNKCLKIGPCLLVITEFELVGRDKQGLEDSRLISSFLNEMTATLKKTSKFPVFIVGDTNGKPDGVLPAIARASVQTIKFENIPGDVALRTLLWFTKTDGYNVEATGLETLAKKLSGFVHEDLKLLACHAVRNMQCRESKQLTIEDFQHGLSVMDKSYSDAIGVAKVPDVKWDDVGGLDHVKEEIRLSLSMTSQEGSRLRRSGMLFYGPPGTGKTLMAKAVATECCMNFLSVKGPELMNMYVGQSEKNVREVFERGREAAPCILFFDELDSLAPSRGKSGDGGGVTDRVVSQLLAEMDGLDSNKGLFVIAATNRPDLVDSALLRPGRFDKMFYLGPLTDVESKLNVLNALTNKFKLASDVVLQEVAEMLPENVTGADLYSVCSNAWLSSARRQVTTKPKGEVKIPLEVFLEDFRSGVSSMVPSLTASDLSYYQALASSALKR